MNEQNFIKFKYTLRPELAVLVQQQVLNYPNSWLYGYMNRGLINRLKHCSMYLITELEVRSGINIYLNPVAIVASNDGEAMTYYHSLSGKDNGTVLAEIVNRCDNIKVEPA